MSWASACGKRVFHLPIALVIASRASRSLAARGSCTSTRPCPSSRLTRPCVRKVSRRAGATAGGETRTCIGPPACYRHPPRPSQPVRSFECAAARRIANNWLHAEAKRSPTAAARANFSSVAICWNSDSRWELAGPVARVSVVPICPGAFYGSRGGSAFGACDLRFRALPATPILTRSSRHEITYRYASAPLARRSHPNSTFRLILLEPKRPFRLGARKLTGEDRLEMGKTVPAGGQE